MLNTDRHNARDYEERYQHGFGLLYPESHIIRINKYVLEWELKLKGGKIFDFGCGVGAHLKYFADCGYEPHGCDTSVTAVEACRILLPNHAANIHVTPVNPDLLPLTGASTLDVFLSNQVLYFMDDIGIRSIVDQAYAMLKPGGVFIATMMSYSCWYIRHVINQEGDFKRVRLQTPRQNGELLINFKRKEDLKNLFHQFEPLHIGSYGIDIREEEGSTDHWIYVGRKL